MSSYSFTEGKWKKYVNVNRTVEDAPEKFEWVSCPVMNVPVDILIDEWQDLISELSIKEEELMKVKAEYAEREFQIKYVEAIDFKELYGRANDDTRAYHVKVVCEDLLDKKHNLELSVDFLKREIGLLKQVVSIKRGSVPTFSVTPPKVMLDSDVDKEYIKEMVRKSVGTEIKGARLDY